MTRGMALGTVVAAFVVGTVIGLATSCEMPCSDKLFRLGKYRKVECPYPSQTMEQTVINSKAYVFCRCPGSKSRIGDGTQVDPQDDEEKFTE